MKSLILSFITVFAGLISYSQDWVLAGSDKEDNNWYVKSSYVKKEESILGDEEIRIWIKKEWKKKTIKKAGKSYTYTNAKELMLVVADCENQRLKFVSSTVYNSEGKVVDNWKRQDFEQEWTDVVPDSVGEGLLKKICELFHKEEG